ncbi:hypothetical protein PACTADRAFT_491 [Pachysolen tannophilus NRRL Y-2460]|uniref:SH3 domain-containing protein n=1 Tax=Pachysolen tannophilus NRRL Y-2460 TaxID=669874 RepID=A0A1E4U1X7_PACTA|nr:hypothetical protein PACTADRAFT_491 [Pachysolen tannophilus NRRL Y-2460]
MVTLTINLGPEQFTTTTTTTFITETITETVIEKETLSTMNTLYRKNEGVVIMTVGNIETEISSTSTSSSSSNALATSIGDQTAKGVDPGLSKDSGLVTDTSSVSDSSNVPSTAIGLCIGIPISLLVIFILGFCTWYYHFRRKKKKFSTPYESSTSKFNFFRKQNGRNTITDNYESTGPSFQRREIIQLRRDIDIPEVYNNPFAEAYQKKLKNEKDTNEYDMEERFQIKKGPAVTVSSRWISTPKTAISKWFNNRKSKILEPKKTSDGSTDLSSLSTNLDTSDLTNENNTGNVSSLKDLKLIKEQNLKIDEKSPILARFPEPLYHINDYESIEMKNHNKNNYSPIEAQILHVHKFDNIKPQVISMNKIPNSNTIVPKDNIFALRNKPLPLIPLQKTYNNCSETPLSLKGLEKGIAPPRTSSTASTPLYKYHNIALEKLQKNKKLRTCRVIKDYHKKLEDEVDLKISELVVVLETHSDGWCLIEKIGIIDTITSEMKYNKQNTVMPGSSYLNEYRGVAPANHLTPL